MEPVVFGLVTLGAINYFARDMMFRGSEWAVRRGIEFLREGATRMREWKGFSRRSVERA